MTWRAGHTNNLPGSLVAVQNDDISATVTTDYHQADSLARKVLSNAQLYRTGVSGLGYSIRLYIRHID